MSASEPLLVMRDVRVRRGRREVLFVESLEVRPGETVALLGPNGAGKSTLLQVAGLLLPAAAGTIVLFGVERPGLRQRVALRRQAAAVLQAPALLDMSVRRNIETALSMHGLGRRERRRRADEWLDRLGIRHLAGARPHTLSGGEAQRVSLARAFAVRPRLLLLDEPFAALDVETRAQLVGDLRDLLESERSTAILTTHDLSEVQLLADRAVVLLHGRVVQSGPSAECSVSPATPEVAGFFGYAVVSADVLGALGPSPGGPAGPRRIACVAPDGVWLAGEHERDAIPARLLAVQGALGHARLVVDVGVKLRVRADAAEIARRGLRPGANLSVRLDPAKIVWF